MRTGRVVKVYQPKVVRQVVSTSAARDVARALEQVTIDGTAKNIHIQDASGAGWSFAGKTGTAQKFVDGAYSHTQFVASFIGFMPAEDPAFVALVMVDDPKTAPKRLRRRGFRAGLCLHRQASGANPEHPDRFARARRGARF
jgi:stage V sporulation protein D (sporulation-specific penicillin-binding protein)